MSNSARPDVAATVKQRPFPWRCAECSSDDVVPAATDYTGQVNYEGGLHTVDVPGIEIPTCRRCGERVFTNRVEEQINAALHAQLHLLTPEQITAAIHALGMETDEVGRRLGIREETLSSWISGTVIQTHYRFPPSSEPVDMAGIRNSLQNAALSLKSRRVGESKSLTTTTRFLRTGFNPC